MKERGYDMPPAALAAIGSLAAAGAGIAGTVAAAKKGNEYDKRMKEAESQHDALAQTVNRGEQSNQFGLQGPTLSANRMPSLIEPTMGTSNFSGLQGQQSSFAPKRGALSGNNFTRG